MNDLTIPSKTIYKSPNEINADHPPGSKIMHRLLLRVLLNEAQKQVASVTNKEYIFRIPVKDIKAFLGDEWIKPTYIRDYMADMMAENNRYEVVDDDGRLIHIAGCIVSTAKIKEGDDFMEFSLNPFIMQKILKPTSYTNVNILMISKAKLDRSDLLYHHLIRYLDAYKVPLMTIKEFRRDVLFIDDSMYPIFTDFRKRVLDPIMKEINEKLDVTCSYTLIKSGYKNSYASIQWTVKAKPGCKPNRGAKNPSIKEGWVPFEAKPDASKPKFEESDFLDDDDSDCID